MPGELGSLSALSMVAASNPAAIAAGTAGTLIIAAAVTTYAIWSNYTEKEHKEMIERINGLHRDYLSQISIDEHSAKVGFPPIFEDKKNGQYGTVRYSEAMLKDIAENTLRTSGPTNLADYRTHIHDAILCLINFGGKYKTDERNITTPVVEYLIHMLESKCVNFSGYSYDIAFLKAITTFINEYAGLFDADTRSRHFAGLTRVYAKLTNAIQELEKQKENRTQAALIEETATICRVSGDKVLRNLVKFITPSEDWEDVDTTPLASILENKISLPSSTRFFFKLFHYIHKAKNLTSSQLGPLIKSLTAYYLESVDSDIDTPPKIPPLDFMHLTKLDPTNQAHIPTLRAIRDTFKCADNFLTTKLDSDPESPHLQFVPLKSKKDIPERMALLIEYAKLSHMLSSFQYVLTTLTKIIQHLGEAEASDPNKFRRIYHLHQEFCTAINVQIRVLKGGLIKIQQSNGNCMDVPKKQRFFNAQLDLIKTIETTITNHAAFVEKRRTHLALATEQSLVLSLRKDADRLVQDMSAVYGFVMVTPSTSIQVTPRSAIMPPSPMPYCGHIPLPPNVIAARKIPPPPPPPPCQLRKTALAPTANVMQNIPHLRLGPPPVGYNPNAMDSASSRTSNASSAPQTLHNRSISPLSFFKRVNLLPQRISYYDALGL